MSRPRRWSAAVAPELTSSSPTEPTAKPTSAQLPGGQTIEIPLHFDLSIAQGGAEGRGEAFFVIDGQALYQAIAAGEVDDADAHADFLDSFKIL